MLGVLANSRVVHLRGPADCCVWWEACLADAAAGRTWPVSPSEPVTVPLKSQLMGEESAEAVISQGSRN